MSLIIELFSKKHMVFAGSNNLREKNIVDLQLS